MTRGEDFIKKSEDCKIIHFPSIPNSAWCDLNSKGDILKLHDICLIPKCKCQKQIIFTPRQTEKEGGSIKKN